MPIRRLPGDAAVQIKSSVTIASLNGAVLGLLRNALDAGATRVTISLDYVRGGCTVEDDGGGIVPAEFLSDGGLGKLHHSSKYPRTAGVHGWRGTFLASLGALSLLTVASCCQGREDQHALTLHNGQVLRRHTPALPDQCITLGKSHGTRVSVRDLFGCMPVRARLRPTSDSSSAWSRDWDELLRSVTALLLAWPSDVAVTIHDENSKTRRCTLRGGGGDDRQDGAALRTVRLFAQAGFCETVDSATWVRVGASVPGVSVGGYVCLVPTATKRAQFIHMGVEPLLKEHQADVLYDEISRLFSESDFGTEAVKDGGNARNVTRGPLDAFVGGQRTRKAVDQWPMYSIGIDLDAPAALDVDDILDNQRQHLAELMGLIRTMFVEFLKKHGFHAEPTPSYELSMQLSTAAASEDRLSEVHELPDSESSAPPASLAKKQKSNLAERPAQKATNKRARQKLRDQQTIYGFPFSSWARTKGIRPTSPITKSVNSDEGDFDGQLSELKCLEASRHFPSTYSNSEDGGRYCGPNHAATDMEMWDENVFSSGETRISRASLEAAKVVGQVDHKFILLRAPLFDHETDDASEKGKAGSSLILVDQHAADERCLVETAMRDYFTIEGQLVAAAMRPVAKTVILEKPLQFDLAANERLLLTRFRGYFDHWGVAYDVRSAPSTPTSGSSEDRVLLRVVALPVGIAERCRQEPKLVANLIRKEIWERSASELTSSYSTNSVGKCDSWVRHFRSCPRGILDLLNSKACHSAIKFNDPLSHEELRTWQTVYGAVVASRWK